MKETLALAFDTETTGIVKANWMPQMWEIGGVIIDQKFVVKDEFNFIVKPRIWPLEQHESDVVTKVSKMDLQVLGNAPDFSDIMPEIVKLFSRCDVMIAHNLAFDRDTLFNELYIRDAHWRFNWPSFHFCTSEALEGAYGKREKLGDWHERVTGNGFKGVHRAKQDAKAMITALKEDEQIEFNLTSYNGREFWQ